METEIAFILLSAVSMSFVLLAYLQGQIWLVGVTASLLVLANVIGPKVVSVFGFAITAGTPLFASLPLATDLLTEKYGRNAAKQAVYVAFFGMLFFAAISYFVLNMQVLPFAQQAGDAVDTIFAASIRLMIASPVAYLVWQMVDISLYHHILKRTGESKLWLRNNISTFVAQAGSTISFFFLGFYGTETPWLNIALVTIIFYWIVAAADTAIIYWCRSVEPRDLKISHDK